MKYYILNKPYAMLSQFTREGGHSSLADIDFRFEKDVYPVGRLDHLSEGLLILTNDPSLNARILNPEREIMKTYLVFLDGNPNEVVRNKLREEIEIKANDQLTRSRFDYLEFLKSSPQVPPVQLPIKERGPGKTCWIEVGIHEGKNRQIRKMTGALGLPALRVIRKRIGGLGLGDLSPGKVREMDKKSMMDQIYSSES